MASKNIGTIECPIKGCRETAYIRRNAKGWLYSYCAVHGNVQSGKPAMQQWLQDNATMNEPTPAPEPEPTPAPEPEPTPAPEPVSEKDDLDAMWD